MFSPNRRDVLKGLGLLAGLGLLTETPIANAKGNTLKYRLGKKPARHVAKLQLRDYITPKALPTPPENFGHEQLISDWNVLGNDSVGNCAIAGPYHAEMLWCAEGKKPINVDTATALATYTAITGYDPDAWNPFTQSNPTDQGSDVHEVAEYWRTTGLKDDDGNVHKIDAYMAVEPQNLEQLYTALYLFDGVGIGIECPEEYQEAFAKGQVWDALTDPHVDGGHYILGVGRRAGLINIVTWGRTQLLTPAGYQQFNDETYVYLSEEKLIRGKTLEGFNVSQLLADMADLASEGPDNDENRPDNLLPICA